MGSGISSRKMNTHATYTSSVAGSHQLLEKTLFSTGARCIDAAFVYVNLCFHGELSMAPWAFATAWESVLQL